jgi:hypothetical protein
MSAVYSLFVSGASSVLPSHAKVPVCRYLFTLSAPGSDHPQPAMLPALDPLEERLLEQIANAGTRQERLCVRT